MREHLLGRIGWDWLIPIFINLVGILKHDGYLNNQEDPARYRFNSPVIREWWWRNVAN